MFPMGLCFLALYYLNFACWYVSSFKEKHGLFSRECDAVKKNQLQRSVYFIEDALDSQGLSDVASQATMCLLATSVENRDSKLLFIMLAQAFSTLYQERYGEAK